MKCSSSKAFQDEKEWKRDIGTKLLLCTNKKVSYSINWSTLVINIETLLVQYILIFLSVL